MGMEINKNLNKSYMSYFQSSVISNRDFQKEKIQAFISHDNFISVIFSRLNEKNFQNNKNMASKKFYNIRSNKLLHLNVIDRNYSDLDKGTIVQSRKALYELTEAEIQEIIRSFGIQNSLSRDIVDEDDGTGKNHNVKGLQKADDS